MGKGDLKRDCFYLKYYEVSVEVQDSWLSKKIKIKINY